MRNSFTTPNFFLLALRVVSKKNWIYLKTDAFDVDTNFWLQRIWRVIWVLFVSLRARSDRASASVAASSLASKIQMNPRAIPRVITSNATVAVAWSEWDNWNLIWSIVSDDADARSERALSCESGVWLRVVVMPKKPEIELNDFTFCTAAVSRRPAIFITWDRSMQKCHCLFFGRAIWPNMINGGTR